jgi:hypothetical protein
VETPLHGQNIDTAQLSEDEFARVSFYRRYGEVGNF